MRSVPFIGRGADIIAGTNARRGGLAAAQYVATSRAGAYDGPDDIEGDGMSPFDRMLDDGQSRLGAAFNPSSMALDYTVGAGLTKTLNGLMPRIGNAIDATRTAVAKARRKVGADAGFVAVAKRLRADRVTPQEMRDQILPLRQQIDPRNEACRRHGALPPARNRIGYDNHPLSESIQGRF